MAKEPEKSSRGLRDLCEALALQYEQQDWGIVNASGRRLLEFISFYEAHPSLLATQKFELGELVIASANEVLREGGTLDDRVMQFLLKNRRAFEAHIEYWRGLQDLSQFPVAGLLRQRTR